MKILVAAALFGTAIYFLFDLRRPPERRSARWGKRGMGPKMSVFSVVVMSAWQMTFAAALLASMFLPRVPPDLEIIIMGAGFAACIACAVVDMILEERKQKGLTRPATMAR